MHSASIHPPVTEAEPAASAALVAADPVFPPEPPVESEDARVARVALALARLIPGRKEETEVTEPSELYEVRHWLKKRNDLPDGEAERIILNIATTVAGQRTIWEGSTIKYFKSPVLRAIEGAGRHDQRSLPMVRTIEGGGAAAKPAEKRLSPEEAEWAAKHAELRASYRKRDGVFPFPNLAEFVWFVRSRPDTLEQFEALAASCEAGTANESPFFALLRHELHKEQSAGLKQAAD